MQPPCLSAAHSSALITLALPCSAALAAGRLASRQTILLNKSALSHSDRLGAARCPRQAPPSLLKFPPLSSGLPSSSSGSHLLVHLPVGLPEKGFDLLCHHLLPVIPGKKQRVESGPVVHSQPSTEVGLETCKYTTKHTRAAEHTHTAN